MDMVERVARAMQSVSRPDVDPDKLTPAPRGRVGLRPVWTLYESMAIAAIKAMREPNKEMASEGFKIDGVRCVQVYTAMIDAALGEHK